jgi:four helix bundle protein
MEKDLEQRTKRFALAVLEFASSLPRNRTADVLARQLLRSATSIGANYREANRGVSRADFTNKIGTVQKEAAETQYWIELLMESGIANTESVENFHKESTELLAIFTSIGKRLKE